MLLILNTINFNHLKTNQYECVKNGFIQKRTLKIYLKLLKKNGQLYHCPPCWPIGRQVYIISANPLNRVINILLKPLQASPVITAYQCAKNAPNLIWKKEKLAETTILHNSVLLLQSAPLKSHSRWVHPDCEDVLHRFPLRCNIRELEPFHFTCYVA